MLFPERLFPPPRALSRTNSKTLSDVSFRQISVYFGGFLRGTFLSSCLKRDVFESSPHSYTARQAEHIEKFDENPLECSSLLPSMSICFPIIIPTESTDYFIFNALFFFFKS
uniref:Uncharacterized protein n=1 Tax=Cacopsylla melanoneura TaxID=428564 RepID=A0A8D8ZEU4_9HEMI